MSIQFEITHGEGVFMYPEKAWDVQQKLGDILDKRDMGELSAKASVAMLDQLVDEVPWFVDGHAHLGFTLLENGKTKKALEALQTIDKPRYFKPGFILCDHLTCIV